MKLWPRGGTVDPDDDTAFLEFVRSTLPSSYSQRFQDLFGLWENRFATTGWFVEFGALNGRDFSNSYLMEQLGWTGVVAEPHPRYAKTIKANRSCTFSRKCVYHRTGDTVTFHAVKGRPALSTIEGYGTSDARSHLREDFVSHEVETITLADLLVESDAPEVVDYLSIDTEGSEIDILGVFDFEKHPIRAISVEHNDHQRQALYDLLTSHGYRRKWPEISGHDDWYVREDLELPPASRRTADQVARLIRSVEPFENLYEQRVGTLASLTD